jgi:PASTA domain.
MGLRYVTDYEEISPTSKVADQKPLAGTEVEVNSLVDLYFEKQN